MANNQKKALVKAHRTRKNFVLSKHPVFGLSEYWDYGFNNIDERMVTNILITNAAHDELDEEFCDDYARRSAENKFMRAKYKKVEKDV